MAINSVVIVGRLTKSPEVKQTQSGVSVCSFCVAVDRQYKSGEERQADFIDCVAWRSTADFVGKWFHKGNPIGIIGHLQTRTWQTDDNSTRKATEVVVDSVSFVSGKKDEQQEEKPENIGFAPDPVNSPDKVVDVGTLTLQPLNDDDDLPF